MNSFLLLVSSWLLVQLWKASLSTISMQLCFLSGFLLRQYRFVNMGVFENGIYTPLIPLIYGHFNISWGDHDDWFMDLVDVFPIFSDTPQTYFLVMLVMSPFSGPRNPLTQAGKIQKIFLHGDRQIFGHQSMLPVWSVTTMYKKHIG